MSFTEMAEHFSRQRWMKEFLRALLRAVQNRGLLSSAVLPGQMWCVCATLPAHLPGDVVFSVDAAPIDELPLDKLPPSPLTPEQLRADQEQSAPHGCALVILCTSRRPLCAGTVPLSASCRCTSTEESN